IIVIIRKFLFLQREFCLCRRYKWYKIVFIELVYLQIFLFWGMLMDELSKGIVADVTATLIGDSIKSGWKQIVHFFKDLSVKEDIEYGIAYEEYLENTKRKYSKIKTIIYRRAPQDLYSFYECIGVTYNGNKVSTESI